MKTISQILNSDGAKYQYEDPRWAKRASSFRSSSGNYCQSCRRKGVAISVHHVNYERGKNLWDYQDEDLAALCEPCHKLIHNSILAFRNIAGHSNAKHIAALTGLLIQLIQKYGDQMAAEKIARLLL